MQDQPISTIRELMLKALALRHIVDLDAHLIVEDYLGAEMEGRATHGIGKFLLIDAAIQERQGKPELIRDGDAFALVDAHRELGQLAAQFSMDLLTNMASTNGMAIIGMINASRYGRLSIYGRMLAGKGLVGIILNNGGPAAVVPYGGIDPILGTNPICFAFPSEDGPVVFDFSTSERVWGEIRQSMLEGKQLPEDAFLNQAGQFTRDPEQADAVLAFGGAKGYALCLAIEILTGALVTAKMGKEIQSQYDIGYLFIAINPAVFTDISRFQQEVTTLMNSIRLSRGTEADIPPRIPGEYSQHQYDLAVKSGHITVDKEVLRRLVAMSEGLEAGLLSNHKVD